MDNASKNAGDMIGRFTLLYNRYMHSPIAMLIDRTRQAAITTELVDIVTGASAV
jgi:F-type H+-transporting ATPase subunit gamma